MKRLQLNDLTDTRIKNSLDKIAAAIFAETLMKYESTLTADELFKKSLAIVRGRKSAPALTTNNITELPKARTY